MKVAPSRTAHSELVRSRFFRFAYVLFRNRTDTDLHSVATRSFCAVEGSVGGLDHLLDIIIVSDRFSYPNANCHGDFMIYLFCGRKPVGLLTRDALSPIGTPWRTSALALRAHFEGGV